MDEVLEFVWRDRTVLDTLVDLISQAGPVLVALFEARSLRLTYGFCEVVLLGWDTAKLLEFGGILTAFNTFTLLSEVTCSLVLWRGQFCCFGRRLVHLFGTVYVQIDRCSHLLDDQDAGIVVVEDDFRGRLGGCAV